ncbi:MAG TPA: DUF4153 domain-containing protein [Candidatus Krumholzibacteria bacterium]|nr:DUF4153 domain-containing protein [Candidatus Krumholzibacteria bacterium]HPD70677.1 DUF4153 domain-containing protein [Candidatus Krumholzibacteria bacterium]HRY39623.1 DUF4153 domain-containing protein [Candidatus Krumholzibacteria bacterium]
MLHFSLRRIGESTRRSLRRFPLTLLSALVAGIAAAAYVDDHDSTKLPRVLLAAQLGIPLFLAASLLAERRARLGLPAATGIVARAIGAALLVAYYLMLPRDVDPAQMLRFTQLNVGLHLLVAVLPFARRGESNGMWQFNLALLLRFLTAAFFSAVLFAGLSVAIVALKTLLDIRIDDDVYLQLWCLIAFVFNTSYFLGGVPQDLAALDQKRDDPKVVRIFAQYILAPLVGVYLAILFVYLVKVVVTAEWPSGWIGYLVSCVAAAGLLSLLLLKPLSERPDNRWVRRYARTFHALMLPAVAMLALAIFKRTDQYGVTEPRYYLIVLTVWLAALTVAGCLRREVFLKAIPASLCALAFVTAFGPWGAFSVSRHGQLDRLDSLLAANARLAGGVLVASEAPISADDRREISAVLDYLFDHFGPAALGGRVDGGLRDALAAIAAGSAPRRPPAGELTRAVTAQVNVPYIAGWDRLARGNYSFRRETGAEAVAIRGYDRFVGLAGLGDRAVAFTLAGDSCRVAVGWDPAAVTVTRGGEPALVLPLASVLAALRERESLDGERAVPTALLAVAGESATVRATLQIERITWFEENGHITRGDLAGVLLLATDRAEE